MQTARTSSEPLIRVVKRGEMPMAKRSRFVCSPFVLALVADALFIFFVTGLNPHRRLQGNDSGHVQHVHALFMGDARSRFSAAHRHCARSGFQNALLEHRAQKVRC